MKKSLLCIAILILALALPAAGQDQIPESKKKLIAELLELTEAKQQILHITDSVLESMQAIYPVMLREGLKETDLTEEDQEEFSKLVEASHREFSDKFRERLPKAIDYDDYLSKTAYPKYDKFFTEKELADMIEFYKTDTGKKVVKVLPQLSDELMKSGEEYLTPKLVKLVDEILKESFPMDEVIVQEGPSPPPAPRKNG